MFLIFLLKISFKRLRSTHSYTSVVKLMKSGKQVVLRHQSSETWMNQYNPKILKTWRANMDPQFFMDPYLCIMYITSYMMKSERPMSELLKRVSEESRSEDLKAKLRNVGSAFLNKREVSAKEAAYKIFSLPLKRASQVCQHSTQRQTSVHA